MIAVSGSQLISDIRQDNYRMSESALGRCLGTPGHLQSAESGNITVCTCMIKLILRL